MFFKIHQSYRAVVALCDKDIIGKRFEEGNMQLDLRENFYKGEHVTHEEAVRRIRFYIKEDATFNIVGTKSVKAAIAAGITSEEHVGRVSGIPFVLIL
jgi:hypothetical protein